MPELCRFLGVSIQIHADDHAPPHVHAVTADGEALIEIETARLYRGRLSPRRQREVERWARVRRAELRRAWDRAQAYEVPGKILPLE